jgi:hypothetical protein
MLDSGVLDVDDLADDLEDVEAMPDYNPPNLPNLPALPNLPNLPSHKRRRGGIRTMMPAVNAPVPASVFCSGLTPHHKSPVTVT